MIHRQEGHNKVLVEPGIERGWFHLRVEVSGPLGDARTEITMTPKEARALAAELLRLADVKEAHDA